MTAATESMFSATVRPSASVSASSAGHVAGAGLRGVGHDVGGELLELLVLRDEVGLAVELDHGAVGGGDETVGRAALGAALLDLGLALDAEQLGGLVLVAGGLLEGPLRSHHPGAGGVAELLDLSGGDVRHEFSVSLSCRVGGRAGHAAGPARVGPAGRPRLRPGGCSRRRRPGRRGCLGGGSLGRCLGGRVPRRGASAAGASAASAAGASAAACLGGRRLGGRRLGGRRLGGRGLRGGLARCRSSCSHAASGSSVASCRRRLLVAVDLGAHPGHQALGHGVGDHPGEQGDGADRVVVARDLVVDLVRVAVGVQDRDDRDVQLVRLADGDVLLLGVDDPHRAGDPRHVADAAEGLGELVLLAAQDEQLLLRHARAGHVVEVELLELLEALQPAVHGLEVGEHAAQPALVDVGHPDAGRLLGDGLLGLLLGADEHHRAAVGDGLLDELVGAVDVGQRLLEVDDVDAVALGEDEPLHLRVPAPGLVAEVHAALEQLLHGDDLVGGSACHQACPSRAAARVRAAWRLSVRRGRPGGRPRPDARERARRRRHRSGGP